MDIVGKIKQFFYEDPEFKIDGDIPETAQLLEIGILDSFSVVKLMIFIEKEFEIKIEVEDLAEENISSLKSLEAFIQKKQKKQ